MRQFAREQKLMDEDEGRGLREWFIPFLSPSPPPGSGSFDADELGDRPADPLGDSRPCNEVICTNTCSYLPSDGKCNDRFSDDDSPTTCALGTDCDDCGFRCCEDDPLFVADQSGKSCAFYREEGPGSCAEHPDEGQMLACPVSCMLCDPPSQQSKESSSVLVGDAMAKAHMDPMQSASSTSINSIQRVWGSAELLALGGGATVGLSVGATLYYSARRALRRTGRPTLRNLPPALPRPRRPRRHDEESPVAQPHLESH